MIRGVKRRGHGVVGKINFFMAPISAHSSEKVRIGADTGGVVVVFIMLLGGEIGCGWFVAEARAVKTIVSLYIKASSLE